MEVLKAFNNHFMEFVEDISNYFNDSLEIKTTANALKAIRKANPKLIINIWNDNIVTKYNEEIEAGNITFFLDKEYGNDLQEMDNKNNVLMAIDKLRKPIKSMPKVDQEKSMKYIQNLSKLCKLYYLNRN
jgi:hypothetical protein